MLIENMFMAISAIKANKMRSFLTMLGIIIGIGSVISIVSIGDSMRALIADEYKNVGVNRALVYINYTVDDVRQSDYFTLEDIEQVKKVFGDEIAYIDSSAYASADAIYGRNKVKMSYQGIDYNYGDVQKINIIYGRMLNESDVLGRKPNIVLEKRAAERLYGTADAVGKTFRTTIYGSTSDYYVVGVYEQEMSALMALMQGMNSGGTESAFIPYTILTWPNDYFFQLNLFTADHVDIETFRQKFIRYEAKVKNRREQDIVYYSAADEMNSMDSMMGGLSVAVGAIAAISLLVGGIGIMNIMLVSVTERTREIGIRKALGARTRDIMIQFLTESALISALGGIIGIAFGVGTVSLGASLLGVSAVVQPSIIVVAVSFSAIVGIFFGLYPASKAAKADPIDALRYE